MSLTHGTSIRVTASVTMNVFYNRHDRSWWAFYADAEGNQLGAAWFGFSRDEVLVHRPEEPSK